MFMPGEWLFMRRTFHPAFPSGTGARFRWSIRRITPYGWFCELQFFASLLVSYSRVPTESTGPLFLRSHMAHIDGRKPCLNVRLPIKIAPFMALRSQVRRLLPLLHGERASSPRRCSSESGEVMTSYL